MPLILVEGLPGSGKTTTTRWIAETLQRLGINARAYLERDEPHPLHAFWTWGDGYRDDEVVEEPFAADKFTRRIVEKWKALVRATQIGDDVCVVEGYPFQSPVRSHLRMGSSRGEIERDFRQFQDAMGAVPALLIYLDVETMETTFDTIVRERGVEFRDLFVGSVVKAPYGRSRGLAGWTGALDFYREYHALVQQLLPDWRGRLLRVCPDAESWPSARARISTVLHEFLGGGHGARPRS